MQQMSILADAMLKFSSSNSVELFMLLSATVLYYILHSVRPRHGAGCAKQQDDADCKSVVSDPAALDTALRVACESGDHDNVVACWNAFKHCGQAPAVQLSQVVTAMRVCKRQAQFIANELLQFFQKYPSECSMPAINGILESLSKQADTELANQVVDILPSLQLALDHNSYEILIAMHVKARQYSAARRVISEMKANDFPLTARVVFFALKVALNMSDYVEALQHFRNLKASWQGSGASEALLPKAIMAQLIGLACKEGVMGLLLLELEGIPLLEEAIECVAGDSVTADALLDAAQNCGRADIVEHLELVARNRCEALRCLLPLQKYAMCVQRFVLIVGANFCKLNAVIGKWVVLVF